MCVNVRSLGVIKSECVSVCKRVKLSVCLYVCVWCECVCVCLCVFVSLKARKCVCLRQREKEGENQRGGRREGERERIFLSVCAHAASYSCVMPCKL